MKCFAPAAVFLLLPFACSPIETAEGHGHDHEHTPHDGVVAQLLDADGKAVGYTELKLHDDKGDLELWIAEDDSMRRPFALDLDLEVTVRFPGENKEVVLRVRDTDSNEDEDGNVNVRDGKTHYFIYPTRDDEDASWLQGADFAATAQVLFSFSGGDFASEEFELVPHTHHDHEH